LEVLRGKSSSVEAPSLILALNETRKTLLASRLLVVRGSEIRLASLAANIRPGDGVWIDGCDRIDTSGMRAAFDVLFLDAEHRVVAVVPNLRPGSKYPKVESAVGVLQLADGTIRLSQTEKGDHVSLEPIVPRAASEVAGARASRG
jgi:uncharacterized protein